jgi:hypothetical protein
MHIWELLRIHAWAKIHIKEKTAMPVVVVTAALVVQCSDGVHTVQTLGLSVSYTWVGLRGLEVAFPPHDPSDADSIPAGVVEFFRAGKFGNEVLRKGL